MQAAAHKHEQVQALRIRTYLTCSPKTKRGSRMVAEMELVQLLIWHLLRQFDDAGRGRAWDGGRHLVTTSSQDGPT